MPYNLASPSGIVEPCDVNDLAGWLERELRQVPTPAERSVLTTVATQLDAFVRWPAKALLLWHGCNRVPDEGKRQKYFSYPESIKVLAKTAKVRLDTRQNGPAIAAFLIAGGTRPDRFGSSNAWSIHHLYSGKFPYLGRTTTTHAAKHALHFTQSAGLVAAHPVADALVDEFPFFAWLLRGHAFLRHGYDPYSVFSASHDEFGFAAEFSCGILESAA
jgi:hypothetical protein